MNTKKFSLQLTGITLLAFVAIALCIRIIPPYSEVFGGQGIRFTSIDAYYHMRLVNLFLQCARFGVKRVIYASSGGAVYGEPRRCPVDESHPINTLSHYGVSKYTAENYLRLYQDVLDYVVLRYANVYGERQNFRGEAGVVAIFSRQMLNGEQPTIFGQGDKTRDYIYVSDVVEANLCALVEGSKTIYNIGTGVETSDQEVFDSLAEIFNYPEKPNYAEVRPGEVHRICLDCVDRQR